MKPRSPFLIASLLTLLASTAHAGEPTIIKPDPLRSDRYQITDSKGNQIETLKRDPMDTRRILITNPRGDPTGYIKTSILPTSNKRYDTFTLSGDHAGSIRQDPLRGGPVSAKRQDHQKGHPKTG